MDANGQVLAYVYGLDDSRDARIAKSLTRDEARRIASNIAKLPDLLGKGKLIELRAFAHRTGGALIPPFRGGFSMCANRQPKRCADTA